MTAATKAGSRLRGGEDFLTLAVTNVDGDAAIAVELPAGLGDCLITAFQIDISAIATMKANPELTGPVVIVAATVAGANQDIVCAPRWRQCSPTRVIATAESVPEVLWRTTETVYINFAEIDTNATAAADANIFFKVRRLRGM